VEPDVSLDLEFDPYHKWLGIPPQHQPPDSYRLLGLEVFESDRDVIRAAAERQTAHIHKYKIGPQSEHSQRLLNEIARARVCLLDPASKAEYDRALRQTANHRRTPDIAAPPVAPPPVAPPHIQLAADPQIPADALPIPDATNDSQSIVPVPGPADFAFRSRKPYRRKEGPAWGLAIAICVVGAVLAAIAIKKLADNTQAETANIKQEIKTVPRDEPVRPTRPKLKPPVKVPPPPAGRLPIPAVEELNKARALIVIQGIVTAQDFLQESQSQKEPAMQYILLEMAIEAAVKEKNREIAGMAIEETIEQYEVDADALRERLRDIPEIKEPPPAAPPERPIDAFMRVALPSGKTVSADDLKPLPLKEIREALSANVPNGTTVFVLKRDNNRPPEGLFAFGNKKEFEGLALVIYPNGRPNVMLSFANNVRNGVLRHWNAEGEIVLFAEFKKGNNLGLTCLCEGDRPILIEEWDTSQKPRSYLIEHIAEGARAIDFDHANAEQRQQMLNADDALSQLRADLLKEEFNWKHAFKRWWDKNDREIKQLQLAINNAPDAKAKAKLGKKLSELIAGIEAERRAGITAIFDNLKLK
jgi:hypothetical protein